MCEPEPLPAKKHIRAEDAARAQETRRATLQAQDRLHDMLDPVVSKLGCNLGFDLLDAEGMAVLVIAFRLAAVKSDVGTVGIQSKSMLEPTRQAVLHHCCVMSSWLRPS